MDKLSPGTGYLVIMVFTVLIYFNSLENEFVFDDESVIQGNTAIQDLGNISAFFTGSEGFHKVIGRYYRPVVSTSFTTDYALWKLDPFGFHLTNILIHLISSLLLFKILLLLFGLKNPPERTTIIAALAGALIFAAHPIHTEAVSWVSGRTDSMVTLFFFASFIYYLKLTLDAPQEKPLEKKGKKQEIKEQTDNKGMYLFLTLLFYFLGLLSKEMIITMPVIIVLFDLVYRRKAIAELKQNIKYYGWFAGVTLFYLVIRYLALKDVPERTNYNYFTDENFITTAATMLKTVPIYFKLLFLPTGLLYHYNGFIADSSSLFETYALLSGIFIISLIAGAIYLYKKGESVISFCILFFVVTLVPVMNIIPTMNLMAERFLYITSFCLSVAASYLVIRYYKKNEGLVTGIVILVILGFGYLTFERNKDWKDNDTLYLTAEGKDGSVLLVNVANIYANKKQYDEAEKRYKRAIEIKDKSVLAHHNLGLIYFLRGSLDSAEAEFKKGIEIDSLAPDGYFMLSNLYQRSGKIPEAITSLEKLQTITPDYKGSLAMLDALKKAPIMPDNIPGVPNMPGQETNPTGILEKQSFDLYQAKQYKEAIDALQQLVKLNPDLRSGYYNNIALSYQGLDDQDNAQKYYSMAIEADAKNVNAMNGMADVFLKKGDVKKAKEYFQKILQVNPADENALRKLDSLKNNY